MSRGDDEEIARRLAEAEDLEAAASDLIARANGAGGLDNVTVLLVRCEADG